MSAYTTHLEPARPASTNPPSLLHELADGSAGPVVRAGVSLALAALLGCVALMGSYILAGFVPDWSYAYSGRFSPRDELVGCMLAVAGVVYLASLIWLWTRGRYTLHAFWKAGLWTVCVTGFAVAAGVFIDQIDLLRASFDVLMGANLCLSGAAIILIWIQAGRHFARGKPLHNPTDGAVDVRCPACKYRMVGLHESRCPECGATYTIDELLAQQEFFTQRAAAQSRST